MPEKLLPNLFKICVPLPENPLGWVNSYVIKGPDRNLIIDTGLNRKECLEAMQTGLHEIGVDLKNTDFYITHNHADHYALVPALAQDTSTIYMNRLDKEYLENWGNSDWAVYIGFIENHGFPDKELQEAVRSHPGNKYGTEQMPEMSAVEDGDILRYGGYSFTAVTTPGHTMGHTCLYERSKKMLLSGDHILFDITPNITCWYEGANPLKQYLASLEKVDDLHVDLVLPGHRQLVGNCGSRIRELKHHHQKRNEEILSILTQGAKSAFEIASMMTWDIDSDSWDAFPASQKWFATGETIAHLRYLEEEGRVFRENKRDQTVFQKN